MPIFIIYSLVTDGQAGIPPGVLNFLSISRENSPKLVAELIGHPKIRHINVGPFPIVLTHIDGLLNM